MRDGGLKHRDYTVEEYLASSEVEPEIVVLDNVITQTDVDEYQNIINFKEHEIEDLADRCLEQITSNHLELKQYAGHPTFDVKVVQYKHDEYPVPLNGTDDDIVVMCNFTKGWKHHWGGEVIFYENSEPSEVVTSFPGRVIVVSNACAWKVTQPNIKSEQNLVYLTFKVKKQ